MDASKLLDISSALSDEQRIRILEALLPGKPLRYTEIMKQLGLDVAADSSKFAYHMGVLCDANLAEKVNEHYRITHGGREVYTSMKRATEGWTEYTYRDSLGRLTGREVATKIWSSILLLSSPFWIIYGFSNWGANPRTSYLYMLACGLLFLAVGAYGYYRVSDDFSDLKLERFTGAATMMLGENGRAISLIQALASLGLITLAIVWMFLEMDILSVSPLTAILTAGAVGFLVVSMYLSSRLAQWWDNYNEGEAAQNYSREIDIIYYILLGVLVISGALLILYGQLGGGVGVLGAAAGTWNDGNKYFKAKHSSRIQDRDRVE
ncbi:MAG TPA: winged helix-turn-helix domain-containing protein [Candidatus Desulfaltia sp.]|nr:winged helix-turn-helix domain-containing protein [Candidatus Desulfaltia sp.]